MRIIQQEPILESDIDSALILLKERIMNKIRDKPKYPFVSPKEAFGKLSEEKYEALVSMHLEDWSGFDSEMLDCAYVCVRYIAGRGKSNRTEE